LSTWNSFGIKRNSCLGGRDDANILADRLSLFDGIVGPVSGMNVVDGLSVFREIMGTIANWRLAPP